MQLHSDKSKQIQTGLKTATKGNICPFIVFIIIIQATQLNTEKHPSYMDPDKVIDQRALLPRICETTKKQTSHHLQHPKSFVDLENEVKVTKTLSTFHTDPVPV